MSPGYIVLGKCEILQLTEHGCTDSTNIHRIDYHFNTIIQSIEPNQDRTIELILLGTTVKIASKVPHDSKPIAVKCSALRKFIGPFL